MRLAKLIAWRDVADALGKVQVLEPGRLGDVEVIDGMQVVIEAWRRDLLRRQSAAVLQAAIDQQDVEPAFGKLTAEHQAVMARADDDPVVGFFERCRHASPLPSSQG
jgi:hypothetical protein